MAQVQAYETRRLGKVSSRRREGISPAFDAPFGQPFTKGSRAALETTQSNEHWTLLREHQNRVHSFGTAQRFDGLQSGLCDRPANIEGSVYRDLDANSA